MSEQARIASIQAKIRKSRNVERMLDVLGIAGVVGSGVGLSLNSVPLVIFGMIAIILTFVGIDVKRGDTQKLIGEQKRMSVIVVLL